MTTRARIPEQGLDKTQLLSTMETFREGDASWKTGRTFSMVYFAGEEHLAFLKNAHNLFFSENGLNPMAFRSLQKMEREVVQMTASMLNGPSSAVGTMTSGGTESILLAVKTYRDKARAEKPWVKRPEILAPTTLHVAFDKACHYFDVTLKHAPLADDFRVDVDAMRAMVNKNTILLAASAPQYPHGVIDPITDVAALARAHDLPMHVDACVGGFILPWVEKAGYPLPPFDFRVDGVTSMSADVHKYGFAAKGASVLLYRDMNFLRHQFFVATDWPGGIYASPTMPGTRPGGAIAAAWASLMAMGEHGFVEQARGAMEAAKKLRDGIDAIDGLRVLGEPVATIVTYASNDKRIDIFAVADRLADRGWSIDRQQHPSCIHCTVTGHHLGVVDEYLRDVRDAVDYVRAHPEVRARGNAAMYGMMAKVPFRGMIRKSVMQVMEAMYGPDANFDPNNLGAGNSGVVAKLMDKYGGVALDVLDRVESIRNALSSRAKKR